MWLLIHVAIVTLKHLVLVPLIQLPLFLWLMRVAVLPLGVLYKKTVADVEGPPFPRPLVLLSRFVVVAMAIRQMRVAHPIHFATYGMA